MMCVRCDQPIAKGQVMVVDVERPTGAGLTVYVHRILCKPLLVQTSPEPRPRRIRGR